jgi:polysaccharide biosynthesis PFTS motif protein
MSPEEVLYLLPRNVPANTRREISEKEIQAVGSLFELANTLAWRERASVLCAAVATVCRLTLGMLRPSVINEAWQNYPRLHLWSRLKSTIGVRTYVDTIAAATMGSYEVLFLRQNGVHTVMQNYSANSRAVSSRIPVDEYHLAYSRILHEYMSIWTDKYAERIRERYSDSMRFHISGPAMIAQPNFDESELESMRLDFRLGDEAPIISVFDIPPQMKGWASGNQSFVPSAYTEDFCSVFIEDVFRLFQEERVTILYKPKRDWSNSNHPCPHRIAKIIRQVEGDGRWITMPPNCNPWIPVLLSDLVIAIPFTSIYAAAIARRTPFLFHNPGRTFVIMSMENLTLKRRTPMRNCCSLCEILLWALRAGSETSSGPTSTSGSSTFSETPGPCRHSNRLQRQS